MVDPGRVDGAVLVESHALLYVDKLRSIDHEGKQASP